MGYLRGLSRTTRVMLMWVVAVCVALLAAGLLLIRFAYPFEGYRPFIAGLAIGCAHSLAKAVLLEKSLSHIIDMQKEGAESIGRLHFIGRYLITAAVFVVVILSRGFFGFFGTIAGVLSLQIAAYITGHLLKDKKVY
ncbi:MAG: hypothetical protein FWG28_07825 [Clostridiales bacterium]|nr:hypothetical protein [Clostridiales bacterium]